MASLTSRQIEDFKNSCRHDSKIEYTYQGRSGSGKVSGTGFMGGVEIQGVLSHVISDYGLSTGMYTSLVVDGKRII
jgi:hypothetical protein